MFKRYIIVLCSLLIIAVCAILVSEKVTAEAHEEPKTNTFMALDDYVIYTPEIQRERVVLTMSEAYDILVLVDQYNKLPPEFSPQDLSLVNVLDRNGAQNKTVLMRYTAARQAEKLFQAASDEGLTLLARSGYRSYDTQAVTFTHWVDMLGIEDAQRFSARPGHSEHQTGLALDITAFSVNAELVQEFGQTKEGIWLRHNAHRFGFIMSYPESREGDTGFAYEPWHFRMVGVDVATYIYENGLILADYLFLVN